MKKLSVTLIAFVVGLTACQNDKQNKSRVTRRVGQIKTQAKADSLKAENQHACQVGDDSDLCRAVYVVINDDGSLDNIQGKILLSETTSYTIPLPQNLKNENKEITLTVKHSSPRQNAKVTLFVISNGLQDDTKENLKKIATNYANKGVTVKDITVSNANEMKQALEEAAAAKANQQVLSLLVSRKVFDLFRTNNSAGLIGKGFNESQLAPEFIENLLLKDYIGSLLYLHYTLPHRSQLIDSTSVRVFVGDTELNADEDFKIRTPERQYATVQIINAAVFKNYGDEVMIRYRLVD